MKTIIIIIIYFKYLSGSLITKALFSIISLLFGIMKTLKFIYTSSSRYKKCHLLLSLCGCLYPITLFIGLLSEGGRNSDAKVACLPPSDSWHVV